MTKDNLDRLKDEDLHKAEEFVQLMGILYTSTLCVSCDKKATCGQIIPILHKLEEHFTVKNEDTTFVATVKEKVSENLSERYEDEFIQAFLHETAAMDPGFKGRPVSDVIWDRLRKATVEANVTGATPRLSEEQSRLTRSTSNRRRSLKERKWGSSSIVQNKECLGGAVLRGGQGVEVDDPTGHHVPHPQRAC
ncbi:uncharacterized protein LOC109907827 isoform X2 [Oncorhynchus kisutch]|uniref:uncharacterized protein LOC109907827 isoform X2 n=1 Tax=Oncorhynchus kisutch TaxID=8019 RepID=UPI0009A064D5|nr:uncharacterized protein LOC109907827 isoform X2 [Oncorhynchus kisutch]